jgi:hypothetical protein
MFEPVEAEALRPFESNVHPVDYGELFEFLRVKHNLANPPELSSLLVSVGEFNQRRKDFFDNPGALVFVVCEYLRNNQLRQKPSNSIITNVSNQR